MSDTMIIMFAALAGELLLLLLVLLSVAWFRGRAARRRDERAIRLLVTRIRNSRAEREAGIGRFLEEHMGLSGEQLEQAGSEILRSELVLLKRFAEVYRGRDADAAARFDADLVAALTPYHELKADGIAVASESAPIDDSELEKLREQNQLLSNELSSNMKTMSKMLREFSTMFSESSGELGAVAAVAVAEPATDPAEQPASDPESGEDQAPGASDLPADPEMSAEAEGDAGAADQSGDPTGTDEEPVEVDLSTPESVDALFAGGERPGSVAGETMEAESPVDGPLAAAEPEDDVTPEADPAADEHSDSDSGGVPEIADAPESRTDAVNDTEPEGPAKPAVQIEAGDDLDEVAELLEEEGPAEVVTFDDPEEAEVYAEVPVADDDLLDEEDGADTSEADDSFDTVDEQPLKVQSQG